MIFITVIFITVTVNAGKLFGLRISFHKIYSCFSSFFGFHILFLTTSIFPLFPCLSFPFYSIVRIITPPLSFFVLWTPTSCPSTYLICSFKKSIFDNSPSALHFYRNLLTIDWPYLFKFILYNKIFQCPGFPTWRNTEGFDRFWLYNQITDK